MDIRTRDEIESLYRSIRQMLHDISKYIDNLVAAGRELSLTRNKADEMSELAHTDALTGVKNRHAYLDVESRMDGQIAENSIAPFAIVMMDVNDLKKVNDTAGHNAGDQYIRDTCKVICEIFKHSPVFRVGGDEFVVVLNGKDYRMREKLMKKFIDEADEAINGPDAVAAIGMSAFRPHEDTCVKQVFERADVAMYENKRLMKEWRVL
jgi:diguanylate cyclase (GGDEF)-like protein